MLAKNVPENIIDYILTNPVVKFKQTETSFFDLTEELDANTAIKLITEIYLNN